MREIAQKLKRAANEEKRSSHGQCEEHKREQENPEETPREHGPSESDFRLRLSPSRLLLMTCVPPPCRQHASKELFQR